VQGSVAVEAGTAVGEGGGQMVQCVESEVIGAWIVRGLV